ncbi:hypothetical protein FQN54_005450 [Arachnomyces sp. PD_36]|nr:hypothetical protein FQN54_005450 [Arachnomyces sp. PD_36]
MSSWDFRAPLNRKRFCVACGVLVSNEEQVADYEFFARDLTIPAFWTSIYRAIISQQRSDPVRQKQHDLHLSGVSRLYYLLWHDDILEGRVFRVPWDRNRVITERSHMIEDGKLRDDRIAIYPARLWGHQYRNYPDGYPIHAHCWTMMERVIGPDAENNLDILLKVLTQRWDTEPPNFVITRHRPGADAKKYPPEEIYTTWDPTDVPEVQAVIRQYTRQNSSEETKLGNSNFRNLGVLDLPLDIIFQIFDYISAADTESILTATQWKLPNSYWRSRFPRKLIFEIDEFISPETEDPGVDWAFLCLGIEKLLENERVYGLQSRQRIFRILQSVKELFEDRKRRVQASRDSEAPAEPEEGLK